MPHRPRNAPAVMAGAFWGTRGSDAEELVQLPRFQGILKRIVVLPSRAATDTPAHPSDGPRPGQDVSGA